MTILVGLYSLSVAMKRQTSPSLSRRSVSHICQSSGREPAGQGESVMTERKQYLLKYVQEVQPQIMEQFADKAHPQVYLHALTVQEELHRSQQHAPGSCLQCHASHLRL